MGQCEPTGEAARRVARGDPTFESAEVGGELWGGTPPYFPGNDTEFSGFAADASEVLGGGGGEVGNLGRPPPIRGSEVCFHSIYRDTEGSTTLDPGASCDARVSPLR